MILTLQFYKVLLQEGSPLPESEDIITDISSFLNTATTSTPRLFWFTT